MSPTDPLTVGGALMLVAVVTVLAGGVPARRASNVNPIEALATAVGASLIRYDDSSGAAWGRVART